MTVYQPIEDQRCVCAPGAYRPRWWTVLAAQLAAAVVYVVAVPVAGIDLEARAGSSTITIDLGAVIIASLVAGMLAVGWLAVLRRFTTRPDRAWGITAGIVLVVSLAGPLGATNVAAGVALACMHLAVGGALAAGSLRWKRDG